MIEQIMCKKPLKGRYLQVQMRDSRGTALQINEIEVIKFGNYSSFINNRNLGSEGQRGRGSGIRDQGSYGQRNLGSEGQRILG
jgi:hypothetical protein